MALIAVVKLCFVVFLTEYEPLFFFLKGQVFEDADFITRPSAVEVPQIRIEM